MSRGATCGVDVQHDGCDGPVQDRLQALERPSHGKAVWALRDVEGLGKVGCRQRSVAVSLRRLDDDPWCSDAFMRTTIRLDDDPHREVKAQAAQQGRTVGRISTHP